MKDFEVKMLFSFGLTLIICGLLLTPTGRLWADDDWVVVSTGSVPVTPAGCSGSGCSTGCEAIGCRVNPSGDTCVVAPSGISCGCAATIPGSDCTGCSCQVHTSPPPVSATSCKCKAK